MTPSRGKNQEKKGHKTVNWTVKSHGVGKLWPGRALLAMQEDEVAGGGGWRRGGRGLLKPCKLLSSLHREEGKKLEVGCRFLAR